MNNIVRIEAKRMYMKIIFVFANFIFFAITLFAEVRLPSILGNGMVLQQKTQTNLWGWATSQKKITIVTSWNNRTYTGYSSFDGKWSIEVETPEAGGPYTITISDGQPIELSDVLIGEVWVCAGQSNVQMPVKGFIGQPVIGSCDAIAMASSKEKIRLLTVLRRENSELQEECQSTSWLETTPSNVKEFSAVAYFFAKYIQNILQVPVGIICSAAGGTNIERWMNKNDYLAIYPDKSMDEVKNVRAGELYNTMIYPLHLFNIKGIIWYQGESNVLNPHEYKQLFIRMVASWREKWALGEFPFYYVQIAPYQYSDKQASPIGAAELRQAQLEAMTIIPNSGMVVTSDVGDAKHIHPADKPNVGKRLALWALAKTYNIPDIPYCGPIYKSAEIKGSKVILSFDYIDMGMTTYNQPLSGFELAGKNGIFYPAKAVFIGKKEKIEVYSDNVVEPVYVQLGFKNYMPLNLYSTYGLPASPFRIKIPSSKAY